MHIGKPNGIQYGKACKSCPEAASELADDPRHGYKGKEKAAGRCQKRAKAATVGKHRQTDQSQKQVAHLRHSAPETAQKRACHGAEEDL